MKINRFNQLNENIEIPDGSYIKITFSGEERVDMDTIRNMDKFYQYEDGDLNWATLVAIEEYLYGQGKMNFDYKIYDSNDKEIEDPNIFKDQNKYNL